MRPVHITAKDIDGRTRATLERIQNSNGYIYTITRAGAKLKCQSWGCRTPTEAIDRFNATVDRDSEKYGLM